MEGFNMNDWTIRHDGENSDGTTYQFLQYKHNEGNKSYTAFYYSPEEIYFEVWSDGNHLEGGLTWNEALNLDITEY
jgi:hypothetical protein